MTLINKYKNDNGSILFVYRKNKNFVKFKILNKNMDFFASSREFLMCEMGNKIDEFLERGSHQSIFFEDPFGEAFQGGL